MIQNEQEASAAANSRASRDNFLIATLERYRFVLPANAIEWRAKRDRGTIPSLNLSSVTLLATDGIVAYFVLGDDETLFFGHLAAFEKDEAERPVAVKKERKLSPRQQLLADL